jgi:hypothetical protein
LRRPVSGSICAINRNPHLHCHFSSYSCIWTSGGRRGMSYLIVRVAIRSIGFTRFLAVNFDTVYSELLCIAVKNSIVITVASGALHTYASCNNAPDTVNDEGWLWINRQEIISLKQCVGKHSHTSSTCFSLNKPSRNGHEGLADLFEKTARVERFEHLKDLAELVGLRNYMRLKYCTQILPRMPCRSARHPQPSDSQKFLLMNGDISSLKTRWWSLRRTSSLYTLSLN